MELQELTQIWKEYNGQLDTKLKVNKKLLDYSSIGKVKSLLKEFRFELIFEFSVDLVFIILLLNILFRNLRATNIFVTCLFFLLLFGLSSTWKGYKLNELLKVKYGESIIETQKRLARLKYYADLETKLLYFLIPLFSMGFIPFLFYMLWGVDIFSPLKEWWFSIGLGSMVIAVIIVWFIRKFPDKKMQSALEFLEEIKDYEK